MAQLINIFKWFFQDNKSSKIGLSQFREQTSPISQKKPSIKNKNVKISDLMRRVS